MPPGINPEAAGGYTDPKVAQSCARASELCDELEVTTERSPKLHFYTLLHKLRGEIALKIAKLDRAAAAAHLMRAVDVSPSQRARARELRAWMAMVEFHTNADAHARVAHESREALQRAYDFISEGLDTGDMQEARFLLESFGRAGF